MSFTKKQCSEISDLSLRAIQYYTERSIVTPEVSLGEGRGNVRKYSEKNLLEFSIIRVLTSYGMDLKTIRTVLNLLSSPLPVDLPDGNKKIDFGGILGNLKGIKTGYIVIYNRGSGKFRVWFITFQEGILEKTHLDQSDSVLVIDLKKIIEKIIKT